MFKTKIVILSTILLSSALNSFAGDGSDRTFTSVNLSGLKQNVTNDKKSMTVGLRGSGTLLGDGKISFYDGNLNFGVGDNRSTKWNMHAKGINITPTSEHFGVGGGFDIDIDRFRDEEMKKFNMSTLSANAMAGYLILGDHFNAVIGPKASIRVIGNENAGFIRYGASAYINSDDFTITGEINQSTQKNDYVTRYARLAADMRVYKALYLGAEISDQKLKAVPGSNATSKRLKTVGFKAGLIF